MTDCILWPGAVAVNGYGRVGNVFAHRFIYELINGPIPDGLFICHRCDTPRCVNPKHLFAGTQTDNMHDMIAKGRARHDLNVARGEHSGASKLTDQDVLDIRRRAVKGTPKHPGTMASLATEYGVSRALISCIVKRQVWKHI